MKKLLKKVTTLLLMAVLLTGVVPAAADAAPNKFTSDTGTSSGDGDYIGSDGQYYKYVRTHCYRIIYNDEISSWELSENPDKELEPCQKYRMTDSNGISNVAYCVEAGIPFGESSYTGAGSDTAEQFKRLPDVAQRGILLALLYGYDGNNEVPLEGCNEDDYRFATQVIVWEYEQQLRASTTDKTITANAWGVPEDEFYCMLKDRPAEKCYEYILNKIVSHEKIPSFTMLHSNDANSNPQQLVYNPVTGKYEITLTDTAGSGVDVAPSVNGVQVTRSGNKYTFSSSGTFTKTVLRLDRKEYADATGCVVWTSSSQALITGTYDPVPFYLALETEEAGELQVVKTSETGIIAGISFKITGNGVSLTVTTDAEGKVTQKLAPGTYTVSELNVGSSYVMPDSKTVTVTSGNTSTVNFSNVLKKGSLTVTKNSEDGIISGMTFRLYGTSQSGSTVNLTAATDAAGKAYFKDVLTGTYTLEEVSTPDRYVTPVKQTVTIDYDTAAEVTVSNVLKKWTGTVVKKDSETGTAQGDGTLSGAVYGLYKDGELVDTYTTDKDGAFTTKEYVCGIYTLKEIKAPEGYILDETEYSIGAESSSFTAEHNTISLTVTDEAVKGKILIVKHSDNGDTQIETPENGAEFEIYLKSAGNYEAAGDDVRDKITADEDGFAESKDLPYGTYTVHQTKGNPDVSFINDFDVFIKDSGKTYKYLINNRSFESYVKIIKKDAETGKTVNTAGAAYKIYDEAGNPVTMKYTYPVLTEINTFYTDTEGYLLTPEQLPYGTYSIVEVSAPYGYVLNSEPVSFEVKKDESEYENGITVVTVIQEDVPQKGIITLTKTGSVFTSVKEKDGAYIPVYTVKPLSGVTFTVTAAEDIITPDGSVRLTKGEQACIITTDAEGKAETGELYPGKYIVKETGTPAGYVPLKDREVWITYTGETESISSYVLNLVNERMKASVILKKELEEPADDVTQAVFGLYAKEELTAEDGSIIPEGGLIEKASPDAEGTVLFKADLPLGVYFVKEIKAPDGYVTDGMAYEFDFTGKTDEAAVEINDGLPIINHKLQDIPAGDGTKKTAGICMLLIIAAGVAAVNVIYKIRKK